MTEDEARAFKEECEIFKDYAGIEEYIEDIVAILVYSSWHFTEEWARERCEERRILIERSYRKKEPAYDCAVDVGYSCG